jgi:predicted regulator of Ras-like GTPase activity (Roadblock/LC7/MglB family)
MSELLNLDKAGSPVAQALTNLMGRLHQHNLVESAVLSTADGLPLETTAAVANQFAAVVGFLMANAQQTCANLSLKDECTELTIRQESGRLLVCRSFSVDNGRLILAVLFKQYGPYTRLLDQTIHQARTIIAQRHLDQKGTRL